MRIVEKQGRQLGLPVEHDDDARPQIVARHPESQRSQRRSHAIGRIDGGGLERQNRQRANNARRHRKFSNRVIAFSALRKCIGCHNQEHHLDDWYQ